MQTSLTSATSACGHMRLIHPVPSHCDTCQEELSVPALVHASGYLFFLPEAVTCRRRKARLTLGNVVPGVRASLLAEHSETAIGMRCQLPEARCASQSAESDSESDMSYYDADATSQDISDRVSINGTDYGPLSENDDED